MDTFIEKYRILALRNIAIGFVATGISVSFLTTNLSFDAEDDCVKFLISIKCVVSAEKLDCRQSIVPLRTATLKIKHCVK